MKLYTKRPQLHETLYKKGSLLGPKGCCLGGGGRCGAGANSRRFVSLTWYLSGASQLFDIWTTQEKNMGGIVVNIWRDKFLWYCGIDGYYIYAIWQHHIAQIIFYKIMATWMSSVIFITKRFSCCQRIISITDKMWHHGVTAWIGCRQER